MDNNLKIQKIKYYLTNPIVIFSLIALICGVILFWGTHFEVPDFYIDMNIAGNIAQMSDRNEVMAQLSKLENERYKIFNPIFHLFGFSFIMILLSIIFKVKKFADFKNIQVFRNRKFIFSWINLSYLPYVFLWVSSYMVDLDKYVYNAMSDSMGIPMFDSIFSMLFFALIYYPAINILYFITYNTKISRSFYSLMFILGVMYYLLILLAIFMSKFSYWSVGLYFYILICLNLMITAIKVLNEKRKLVTK